MAPEFFSSNLLGYNKGVDIWATGLILYMLIVGEHPLRRKGESKEDYIRKLKEGNIETKFPELTCKSA